MATKRKKAVPMTSDVIDSYFDCEGLVLDVLARMAQLADKYGDSVYIERVPNQWEEGYHYEVKVERPETPAETAKREAKAKEAEDNRREWELKQLATLKARYENK